MSLPINPDTRDTTTDTSPPIASRSTSPGSRSTTGHFLVRRSLYPTLRAPMAHGSTTPPTFAMVQRTTSPLRITRALSLPLGPGPEDAQSSPVAHEPVARSPVAADEIFVKP